MSVELTGLEVAVVVAERRHSDKLTSTRDRRYQKARRALVAQLIGTLMHKVLIVDVDDVLHQLLLLLGRQ